MLLNSYNEKICEIPDVDFGKIIFCETENNDCCTLSIENVSKDKFEKYLSKIKNFGYSEVRNYKISKNFHSIFEKDGILLYLSYYPNINEMRAVGERNSIYLSFDESNDIRICESALTQIDLEGFGLSYVIRLADGRFIIFDGGWEFEVEADKIMNILKEQSPFETPKIAAWIFTHPHIDHYRAFLCFYPKYKNATIIEKIIYNFPILTEENIASYPDLQNEPEFLARFEKMVKDSKIPVLKGHTGQILNISNAKLEILSSPDDYFKLPMLADESNNLSLMIKLTIDRQPILFCADGYFKESKIIERYGDYLKSDILQIPHHGIFGGNKEGYRIINPDICFLPGGEMQFYSNLSAGDNGTLVYDLDVKEIFTGHRGNITIPLPYTPRPNGRKIIFENLGNIQNALGAKVWYFADMKWDDCKFSVLNVSGKNAEIYANLYFEDPADKITMIKIDAQCGCVQKVDFNNPADIDDDAKVLNYCSLKRNGMDKTKSFTIRFISDIPVIVICKKEPVYKS